MIRRPTARPPVRSAEPCRQILIDMIDDRSVEVEPGRVGPRALRFLGEQTVARSSCVLRISLPAAT